MAKYLDPKADLTFKKVFGEHKDLVVSLLNALLPLPKESRVESVEYLPPEVLPEDPLHKDSIVDVRCRDQLGRQFVVEMQMIWTVDYKQRALFNAAKTYVRQLNAGEAYKNLKTVYSLNLINDIVYPEEEGYYHYYLLEHQEHKGKTIDDIQIVFVELPKFTPQTYNEKKMQVLWLRFLTEINEGTRRAPAELEENPEVKKALDMVEESALDEAERARYDGFVDWLRRERGRARLEKEYETKSLKFDAMKTERDAERKRADTEKERADAAEARISAEMEKLRQSARQMKADGLDILTIMKYTGLTEAEIAGL